MVALAPPAASLSDSRALWLTGVVGLTGGLLSGATSTTPGRRLEGRPREASMIARDTILES